MAIIDEKCLRNLKKKLIKSINLAGINITQKQIDISDWGCPHESQPLPKDKMAVYTFFYKNECLKVGKADKNSNSRYASQNYNPSMKSSNSNLAKSICKDNAFCKSQGITEENIGCWIKKNTHRINFLIDDNIVDDNVRRFVLNFAEAFLQLVFKPKYEGRLQKSKK